jgi:hypothetical protein
VYRLLGIPRFSGEEMVEIRRFPILSILLVLVQSPGVQYYQY